MLEQGVIVNSAKLNPAQYISKLKDKLLEEVREVKEAESVEDLKIELADVLEVISALLVTYGIFEEEIEKITVDKVNRQF